jgi:hypothetical protein
LLHNLATKSRPDGTLSIFRTCIADQPQAVKEKKKTPQDMGLIRKEDKIDGGFRYTTHSGMARNFKCEYPLECLSILIN